MLKTKSSLIFFAFFVLLTFFTATSFAQTVDEIISKYIEAKGGYENLKSIKTIRVTGTGTRTEMGMEFEFPVVVINKRPNKFRMEATIQGMSLVNAYDGKTAWQIFPFMGDLSAHELTGKEARDLMLNADIDGPLVDYKKKGHKIELIGKEDVEGSETYKLKVTLKNGDVVYYYLDSEYYVELKISSTAEEQGNTYELDQYFSDFKEVDGILMPHSFENRVGGNTIMTIKIEKVELNVDIDDSIFNMPESKG